MQNRFFKHVLTISGPGATSLAISGNGNSGVFNVVAGATVSISGLTIQNGLATPIIYQAVAGGGIYNAGSLTLSGCIVSNNATAPGPRVFGAAPGGNGAGIYNAGTMLVSNCIVCANSCAGSLPSCGGYSSAYGGSGGGIYNTGTLSMSGSTLSGNSAGRGAGGCDDYSTGSGGSGGGLYNVGVTMLSGCIVNGNSAGGGGASDGGNPGGSGGSGGGICNGGTLTMSGCCVYGNSSGGGGWGGHGINSDTPYKFSGAPGGGGGSGGGIYGGGVLTLINCTIYGNSTGNGGPGGSTSYEYYNGGNGGSGGSGGGIYGGGTIINCTIAGNSAAGGGSRGSGYEGTHNGNNGSPGNGGGIGCSSQLLNTLIANNSAAGSGPDVSGSFTSLGHNLIGNATGGSGFGATGDLLNVNLQLGPLANNGGPTLTCPLLPGSPAIDAGDDAVLSAPYNLITDQRGFPRLSGSHVDIGAFEFVFLYPGDDLCDGISDAWRAQYFGGNGAATNGLSCATCDADGTGQDNLFKYLAGLDPTNPSSIFGITAIARKSNDVLVTWTCVGSHSYVLQSTRSTAMIAEYNTNFADASPIIIASGLGPTTTNYLDVGAAYAPLVTSPGGTMVTTSVVPSTVDCSAVWTRGITDSLRQALPIGSLLMLGTFSISEPTIQSNFSAGNVSAIMSNFTPYSMSFKVGDGTGLPATWSVSLSAAGFGGQQIYLLAIDKPTFAAAKHLGIFTAPSWVFPDDGCEIDIDLEDVTDFVIGTQGGPLTINLVLGGETYTFNDTARLSYLPGRSLFYRVRLAQ
jgi:hypothetical protein